MARVSSSSSSSLVSYGLCSAVTALNFFSRFLYLFVVLLPQLRTRIQLLYMIHSVLPIGRSVNFLFIRFSLAFYFRCAYYLYFTFFFLITHSFLCKMLRVCLARSLELLFIANFSQAFRSLGTSNIFKIL